jgi:predicted deacylase
MITKISFDSGREGQHLLVFGGIHGDEVCGPIALQKLVDELESGVIKILTGKITIVPVCNPKAYEQQKRFIDKNLNRVIMHHPNPTAYEEYLANEIVKLISDTQADALLDLHSYTSGTRPFLFVDSPSDENIAFAKSLSINDWITGWSELYPPASGESDTTGFADTQNMAALTIECGQHKDPAANDVAYQTTIEAMSHFGILNDTEKSQASPHKNIHRLEKIIVKEEGGDFIQDWQHLDTVRQGTVMAVRSTGQEIIAKKDSVILLPHREATVGSEWFYLGVLQKN